MIQRMFRHPKRVGDRLKRFFIYMRRFGALRGAKAAITVAAGTGEVLIDIPQVKAPVALRRGTTDLTVFEQVFVFGIYELPFDFEPRFIIDGGANVGYTSVYFASRYPGARIVAVEPEPANAAILRRNVAPYPNVTVVEAAIWHEHAPVEIANPGASNWAFRVRPATSGSQTVDALTPDELADTHGAAEIDILKLDIEGAEREVLSHSAAWLGRVGILIVELHEATAPGANAALRSAIASHDFEPLPEAESSRLPHLVLISRSRVTRTPPASR